MRRRTKLIIAFIAFFPFFFVFVPIVWMEPYPCIAGYELYSMSFYFFGHGTVYLLPPLLNTYLNQPMSASPLGHPFGLIRWTVFRTGMANCI